MIHAYDIFYTKPECKCDLLSLEMMKSIASFEEINKY